MVGQVFLGSFGRTGIHNGCIVIPNHKEVLKLKGENIFKGFGFIFISLMLNSFSNGYSAVVNENEAVEIANLWYAMELNSGYLKVDDVDRAARFSRLSRYQVLYLVSRDALLDTPPDKSEILAYVIKYEPSGFVVVSGEDHIQPIIVFSADSEFRWDQPEHNFLRYFLGKEMVKRWEKLEIDVHPNWTALRARVQEGKSLQEVTLETPEAIFVQWETALWHQSPFYNDVVIANNGNIPDIATGCTATAMAIKMRFHEWPLIGNSSHSYTDNEGSVQYSHSINFGAQTYIWSNMPTTSLTAPNLDVANLMYHCGVAVDMDYEVRLSGAWPSASSMNNYFRYKGTIQKTSAHEEPMITSIRGALPVVLSTTDHTVVADGYRDTMSPYFHLNVGWNGASNGWYNLDQIPGDDDLTIDRSYPYCSPNNFIYVDSDWTGSENGDIQNPFNTLAEGETSVPSDGQLWIKEGTYAGAGNIPITFDNPMTIRTYQGTAIVEDRLSLTTLGRIWIYGSGSLKIY